MLDSVVPKKFQGLRNEVRMNVWRSGESKSKNEGHEDEVRSLVSKELKWK
jgi:hypothetical protein